MLWKHFRNAMVAGLVLAAGALEAQAGACGAGCVNGNGNGCGDAAAGAATTSFRTVHVTEYVAENYETTRTVYRTEERQETYTAYREECVPETRTRTYTIYKKVPEVRQECRTVCEYVCVEEQRTVMKKVTTCKPVTTICRKCVDRGHWECIEVEVGPSLLDRLRHACRRNDCCDPCPPCPRTKTKKVWCPNKVWEEYPVTKMERVTECVPTICTVKVRKPITRQITVNVCTYKCIPETKCETYTVHVKKCVPYQATRCVKVCVPVQEKVTCCRMVPRCVAKQVPVTECCAAPSCDDCCTYSACCHKRFRFGR